MVPCRSVRGWFTLCPRAASRLSWPGPSRASEAAVRASVGELFAAGSSSLGCTASVVRSARGNVVLAAAHCLVGTAAGTRFVPGYAGGARPYGTWTVTAAYVDRRWRLSRDRLHDYAFLVLAGQTIAGRRRQVQELTGAERLSPAGPLTAGVAVPAYMSGRQVSCTAATYRTGGFSSFDCGGFAGGTSGGSWLLAPAPAPGAGDPSVVGVIGGLHQGGCFPWTSYSAPFDSATAAVFARAATGGAADVLPVPGGDGC